MKEDPMFLAFYVEYVARVTLTPRGDQAYITGQELNDVACNARSYAIEMCAAYNRTQP